MFEIYNLQQTLKMLWKKFNYRAVYDLVNLSNSEQKASSEFSGSATWNELDGTQLVCQVLVQILHRQNFFTAQIKYNYFFISV